jgi:hypothetical protein
VSFLCEQHFFLTAVSFDHMAEVVLGRFLHSEVILLFLFSILYSSEGSHCVQATLLLLKSGELYSVSLRVENPYKLSRILLCGRFVPSTSPTSLIIYVIKDSEAYFEICNAI